jgi:ribosomal protein L5
MARLQEFYKEKVVADLTAKFGYKSVMEVPRLTKITLNMGVVRHRGQESSRARCWRPDQDRRPEASDHQGP